VLYKHSPTTTDSFPNHVSLIKQTMISLTEDSTNLSFPNMSLPYHREWSIKSSYNNKLHVHKKRD